MIIDGTGKPGFAGDIGVNGDRIAAIAEPGTLQGRENLDVSGHVVSPGFIDVHTHDDRLVLIDPAMAPKVSQGISTVIVGNCGISLSPLLLNGKQPPQPLDLLGGADDYRFGRMAEYIEAVEAASPAVNVAALVGHSSLRVAAMGDLNRPATDCEIEDMRLMLAAALDDGAIGLSSGLYYPPARAAVIDEVVPLAREVALAGGVYTTHMRDEDDFVMESLEETFETGRRADVPVVVSHHKCAGRRNWGRSVHTLQAIEAAAAKQEVGVDAYPYAACSTILLPEWVDESIRVMVTWSTPYPEMAARDLADIATEWGVSQKEASARLAPAGAVYFDMHEDDVRRILANPLVMIGSDGIPHDQHPHPRLWGTFPRVLGHYSRDIGLFSLEEAVRKMTSLPATKFRLKDRGRVTAGYFADLVVFDPATVMDAATFEKPIAPATGIKTLLVNGKIAYSNADESVSGRSGRFIRRRAIGSN
ncbi:D-aminoacylase [Mycoplana sp. BE70]|uniref:N-acyl-D-amino-acid deacylase family protein n=1 Tax=Mycoplana sp. BE70 TaxID=2817775 RepID=UPI00286B2C28|nr:D-aminoacylase [Mycoplana sp. BE70]